MQRFKVLAVITVLLISLTSLVAEDCGKFGDEYKKVMKQYKKAFNDMSSPEITKEEYDALDVKRKKLWSAASKKKKLWKECEENNKSIHKKHYNDGLKLKKGNDFAGALVEFEKAIKVENDFQPAINQAAFVSIELGDLESFEKYVVMVKEDSKKGKLYKKLGKKFVNLKPKTAIKYYSEMAKYYQADEAFYKIGIIYSQKLFKLESGITYFKKSIKVNPKNTKVFEALGATLNDLASTKPKKEKTKLNQSAFKYLTQGTKTGDKNYKRYYLLYYRLAKVSNELNKSKTALANAELSIKSNKKNPEWGPSQFEKGLALFNMKKFDKSKASFLIAKKDLVTRNTVKYYLDQIDKINK